ncbi:hypothetical protein ANN_08190 [Periplaneta americana]|uniref:Reverse transcriptase domain-containing protein n=1 Tax=Periplaneta americana TaxID=6978 RepID=A0ABQ8T1X2_PERAM|nr:hypothetical protein ANN_08190 [Periplaneta americana]
MTTRHGVQVRWRPTADSTSEQARNRHMERNEDDERAIMEKKWEYKGTVHQSFIDFKKAYESVKREVHQSFIDFKKAYESVKREV